MTQRRQRGPRRLITQADTPPGYDTLECGHVIVRPYGSWDARDAAKRHCGECLRLGWYQRPEHEKAARTSTEPTEE